ncbi:MAG: hypothetical protein ACYCT9_10835 [Leptospirillum sp.]|jgi:hypothetical protein
MKPFYQRVSNLSNQSFQKLRPVLMITILGTLILQYGNGFAQSQQKELKIVWPPPAKANERMTIQVFFPQSPVNDQFYRMEVDIDGKAVAISDISRTKRAAIDLPPLTSGMHAIKLLWLNPAKDQKSEYDGSIKVLPEK